IGAGVEGGGRADRLEVLPRYSLVDDVADFARAAVVAVRVVALDIAAGGVAVARADVVAGRRRRVGRRADHAGRDAETDRRAPALLAPRLRFGARRRERADRDGESRERTRRDFGELGHDELPSRFAVGQRPVHASWS